MLLQQFTGPSESKNLALFKIMILFVLIVRLFVSVDEAAQVRQMGPWGYVDKAGKVVIEPQFVSARGFAEGLAAVSINAYEFDGAAGCGYINTKGEFVIPPQFDWANDFSQGLAPVRIRGKWGFIDKSGHTVIKLQFDEALPFADGLAAVRVLDKWGFIDKAGRLVIKPQFDST